LPSPFLTRIVINNSNDISNDISKDISDQIEKRNKMEMVQSYYGGNPGLIFGAKGKTLCSGSRGDFGRGF
tara:strand:+ start:865 stop:1074 length:210 start_codon:yes stop_codon:yes gene_type:complete